MELRWVRGRQLVATIDPDTIQRYHRDGVVALRDVFADRWLQMLRRGIDRNLRAPSERFEARTSLGTTARYYEDFWVWSLIPEFEQFLRDSPVAEVAGQFMQASRVNLVMDNWFWREAGAKVRAPWHHDIAYFDFDGTLCVVWVPLEATSREGGIEFVRGSHQWNRLFTRVWFKDHRPAAADSWVTGKYYEQVPDIDGHREDYDIVSFDLAAGDCLLFDIRTLHAGTPGPATKTARRYSVRLCAEDGHLHYRGDWAKGERQYFEAFGHREGDSLNSDFFPVLWEA